MCNHPNSATPQVEAEDFSQELYHNVNMGTGNPLYDRRGRQSYLSVLQGQLRYNTASRETASAKYTYVVSRGYGYGSGNSDGGGGRGGGRGCFFGAILARQHRLTGGGEGRWGAHVMHGRMFVVFLLEVIASYNAGAEHVGFSPTG